ncbi:MAG: hypothetical protein ACI97N_000343 [Cognaticolwellia sp.]|jgi:hypothetical protein
MKKLIKQSLMLVFLLTLSVSAFLYVNVSASQSVSDKDDIRLEEQVMEEKTENDVIFMEIEFLKSLIHQGVKLLSVSNL